MERSRSPASARTSAAASRAPLKYTTLDLFLHRRGQPAQRDAHLPGKRRRIKRVCRPRHSSPVRRFPTHHRAGQRTQRRHALRPP